MQDQISLKKKKSNETLVSWDFKSHIDNLNFN